jgi:hypothetical protein
MWIRLGGRREGISPDSGEGRVSGRVLLENAHFEPVKER